jgi:triosephosphate isomerase (TIM)
MHRPVFVANWKMNLGPAAARTFMTTFARRWPPRNDRTLIFCPPAISLTAAVAAVQGRDDLAIGAQNIWTEDTGPFTGETSAVMVKEAGARFVIVGHSERRHVFGETDAQTAKKCAAAARNDLTPLLCVGELLHEREAGAAREVVLRQLDAGLAGLSAATIAEMAVAYEPVWAIGTGKTATAGDASQVHGWLRDLLRAKVGDSAANIPILYGGSVSATNAAALLAARGVDGLLVGGASLEVDGWISICNT